MMANPGIGCRLRPGCFSIVLLECLEGLGLLGGGCLKKAGARAGSHSVLFRSSVTPTKVPICSG